MTAQQQARSIAGNPVFVGWCIGVAFALLCTVGAASNSRGARSDREAAADLLNHRLEAAQEVGVLNDARERARLLMPQLVPLCASAPPAIQALLVVTDGAPGLQLRVTSSDTPPKAEGGEETGALLVSATGTEADLARWLMRVDNNPDLRDSIALRSVDRPAQSQDTHAPASASRISANVQVASYAVDSAICREVRSVAEHAEH
ncbi:hypothetical protein EPN42_04755 [bacterium]|nr:MAG: hypothetical protein EPN42_04755 [bacterium]